MEGINMIFPVKTIFPWFSAVFAKSFSTSFNSFLVIFNGIHLPVLISCVILTPVRCHLAYLPLTDGRRWVRGLGQRGLCSAKSLIQPTLTSGSAGGVGGWQCLILPVLSQQSTAYWGTSKAALIISRVCSQQAGQRVSSEATVLDLEMAVFCWVLTWSPLCVHPCTSFTTISHGGSPQWPHFNTEVWIYFYLTISYTHTFNCKQERI